MSTNCVQKEAVDEERVKYEVGDYGWIEDYVGLAGNCKLKRCGPLEFLSDWLIWMHPSAPLDER